jgi:hypothetical protein
MLHSLAPDPRARGTPGFNQPMAPVQEKQSTGHFTPDQPEDSGVPRAVFEGLLRSTPGGQTVSIHH